MSSVEVIFDKKVAQAHEEAVLTYIVQLSESGLPAILSLDHFAKLSGFTAEAVFGMTNSPCSYYRSFDLRKKSGGKRRIDAPLPTLLRAQRWILRNILETRACHPAAKAYLSDTSIKLNARFHRAQTNILKMDVSDFFGSISEFEVTSMFEGMGYRRKVAIGLAKICCLDGALPQGAPTSGYLSNLFMHDFDKEFFSHCRKKNYRYTRYADDITISSHKLDRGEVVATVSSMLSNIGLRVNKSKTRLMKPNNRQKVTGVVVNTRLSVERTLLKKIRQECYFVQKFGIYGHARKTGSKDPRACLERLLGQVSHAVFIRSDDKYLKKMKALLLEERRNAFGF